MTPGRFPSRIADLVLGSDAHQRVRASQSLLALALLGGFALIQHVEVMLGLMDLRQSNWLTAFSVGTGVLFFVAIRSNWNLVLSPREPSLTLPQSLAATTSLAWSYAITGPARGSLLALMILLLMFGGLFQLRPRVLLGLAGYAFALLVAVMVWRSAGQRYDPRIEAAHALFAATTLGGAAVVALRLGGLRRRLSQQKHELARALDENRQLANRDPLTGLLNRRALIDLLREPVARSRGGSNALALLDLDFFKRINDGHGHGVGDQVLRKFGAVARQQFRSSDLLARWGGEEFLLVMRDASVEQALMVLNRLRARIAAAGFETLAPGLVVTFSGGVAAYADGADLDAAIERADRALYRAKEAGRDRVLCAADDAPPVSSASVPTSSTASTAPNAPPSPPADAPAPATAVSA